MQKKISIHTLLAKGRSYPKNPFTSRTLCALPERLGLKLHRIYDYNIPGLIARFTLMTQGNSITERYKNLGIVGAGGGGFPTHIKLTGRADVVIVNGAECEPLLHKDKELMAAEPDVLLEGIKTAMISTGASRAVIGIKTKAKSAISALTPRMDNDISMHLLKDTYPAGDEFVLTYEVTGKIPPPGGLPLDVGAVVSNVETLVWLGRNEPVTEKLVTVAGEVTCPATYRVPVGTPCSVLLEAAGQAPGTGVLCGGVMMGSVLTDPDMPVTKTLGGLIVLPRDHPLYLRYIRPTSHRNRIARSACDQCNFCTQLCPRYLLGHPVEPHLAMRHIGMAAGTAPPPPGSLYCCGCNLCSFWSCPEDLDPGTVTVNYRSELQKTETQKNRAIPVIHPMFQYRKPSISALKRRLGLDQFTDDAPLQKTPITVREVNIPLLQHIGAPAEPVITPGSAVRKGDLIGRIPEGKLGAAVHASIDGEVTEIGESIRITGGNSR